MNKNCPLCQSDFYSLDQVYNACKSCGLHVKKQMNSMEITNEALDKKEIMKLDGLTKFKISAVIKLDKTRKGLLDIGTASGKFLYHARSYFESIQGVEVNQKCIDFADKELELKLMDSIEYIDLSKVSCITLWHSLEHIPLEVSQKILSKLSEVIPHVPILISVPNGDSFQFKIFRDKWPYYDKSSHLYQYNPHSLNLLMTAFGYKVEKKSIGLMYEFFGHLQGLVNLFHPIENYFYYRKKRGWTYNLSKRKLFALDVLNYFQLIAFLPVSLIFLVFIRKKEGVINFIFRKNC